MNLAQSKQFNYGYCRSLLFVLLMCGGTRVFADTVYLKNADRLTGRVTKIADDVVRIKTAYAGELSISLNNVSSVITDDVIELRLKSGLQLKGQILSDAPGSVLLDGKAFLLSDLVFDAANEDKNADLVAAENPLKQHSFHGRAEASVESLQNKTQTRYAEVDLNLSLQRDAWRHTVDIKKRNDSEDGEKTEDSQKLEYSVDYFLTPDWFLRGNRFYQRDRVTANSDLHYNGLGIGRNLWKDQNGSWEIVATYNKLVIGGRPLQFDLNTWLLSTEYKRKFDNEKWDVYAKADVLFPQHIPVKLILQSEAGLRYQLNAQIYLTGKLMFDLVGFSGGNLKSHSYKFGVGTKW